MTVTELFFVVGNAGNHEPQMSENTLFQHNGTDKMRCRPAIHHLSIDGNRGR